MLSWHEHKTTKLLKVVGNYTNFFDIKYTNRSAAKNMIQSKNKDKF